MSEISEYEVLEMPLGAKGIRMEEEELRKYCNEYKLPIFKLKVEEHIQQGIHLPLDKSWRKLFSIKWDWVFWAAERIEGQDEGPEK